jgi:hypothetical protein
MLRPPFPSQRVRVLHAYVDTPYVFVVRPRMQLLNTQACHVCSCMVWTTRRHVTCVRAWFGKHNVCFIHQASAVH